MFFSGAEQGTLTLGLVDAETGLKTLSGEGMTGDERMAEDGGLADETSIWFKSWWAG